MNKEEFALKSLLDDLGINPIITRFECIQQVQDAVYEQSKNGIDLGYVFGDYPVGKFSPELRDVHRGLSEAI